MDTSIPEEEPVEAQDAASSEAFSILVNKKLPHDILDAVWCPTMDLVAFLTKANSVSVHRLEELQRLCVLNTDDEDIASICWRPDGKSIVTSFRSGAIAIWNIENGERICTIFSSKLDQSEQPDYLDSSELPKHTSDVIASTWVDETGQHTKLPPDCTRQYFNSLSPIVDPNDPASVRASTKQSPFAKPPSSLNTLVTSDSNGDIITSALGIFPLATANVASLLKTADIDVISSAVITSTLTKDYKTLAIIAKATPKQKSEQLLLLSVNTSKIDENREELLHLSWQYQLMTEELRHVEKSIESIFEASTEATQKLKSYMQQLNGMLRDENLLSTPESEFLELLLRGIASIPLEQFLGHKLKLSGAKMLNRLFDAAFETLESLLPDHLLQAAATVQHRVSELLTRAMFDERWESLGLSQKTAEALMDCANELLIKCKLVLRSFMKYKSQIGNFLDFLNRSLILLAADSANPAPKPSYKDSVIVDFLRLGIDHDPFNPRHLKREKDIDSQHASSTQSLLQALSSRSLMTDDTDLRALDLQGLFKELKRRFNQTFSEVMSAISATLTLDSYLVLHNEAAVVSNVHVTHPADNALLVSFHHDTTTWMIRHHSEGDWFVTGFDPLTSDAREGLAAFRFYTPTSGLVVKAELEDDGDEIARTTLSKVDLDRLGYQPIKPLEINKFNGVIQFFDHVVMARPFETTFADLHEKTRKFEKLKPLGFTITSSPARTRGGGIAALWFEGNRIIVADIENDDEGEEEAQEEVADGA